MYKLLYRDYKKVCEDKKQLQQDIVKLMKEKEWDTETASLNLKLMRAERKIALLNETLDIKKESISNLKRQRIQLIAPPGRYRVIAAFSACPYTSGLVVGYMRIIASD